METCSWDAQLWFCLYQEAKQWQAGIAALVGFLGLIAAALWNFRLNRRRDAQLRADEMISVASALYGEILLLRKELALLATVIANVEIKPQEMSKTSQLLFTPDSPQLYHALAGKPGLIPSRLLLGVTQFYAHLEGARLRLEIYCQGQDTGVQYSASVVLEDAVKGVEDVKPVLRTIEELVSVPMADDPSTGMAEAILENERINREER